MTSSGSNSQLHRHTLGASAQWLGMYNGRGLAARTVWLSLSLLLLQELYVVQIFQTILLRSDTASFPYEV